MISFLYSPTVGNIFDKVKEYEENCLNPTAIPQEVDSDEAIESRLLNLKFFNQNYLYGDKTNKEISDESTERFETIKDMAVINSVKDNEVKNNLASKPEAI